MSIFLKKFETTSAYETYINGGDAVLPNVSFCEDEKDVHYNPYVPHDYSKDYFTMVVTTGGDITWEGTALSYSTDDGATWSTASNSITLTVNEGDKVLWKGTTTPTDESIGTFGGYDNVRYSVEGNIMSLLFGDNFKGETSLEGKNYVLSSLFNSNTKVTSAENLSLPATALAENCYTEMFTNCTSLTTAPELPATTLASSCYYSMFSSCTSLTAAPELPATELVSNCYQQMFDGCTSLTTAPELPATTLANYCYESMFYGCTSLTTAPELPATTLAEFCYSGMFSGCASLTTAPELPATTLAPYCYSGMFSNTNVLPDCTNIDFSNQSVVASGGLQGLFAGTKITDAQLDTILKEHGINNYSLPVMTLADYCYNNMFSSCKSLTTAPQLPATTLAERCYSSMFQNCTSLTTAPELPATTLANYCYFVMFSSCTSLTAAPELPATTLTQGCYGNMFKGCTKLNSIKCLATNISASDCTSDWVNGVVSSGTFTKAASMTNWTRGKNGIPSGWTVVDAA